MANTLKNIIKTAENLGYTIDKRPSKLNLIGVRNSNATNQQSFDDQIAYFYYDNKGNLVGKIVPATTDPSTDWLEDPMNPSGAAILKSGEYKDAYAIGKHKKIYNALVQVKPVTVIRDNDRNSLINYLAPTSTGLYGINIHKSSKGKNNQDIIGKDSAGCQVFRNIVDFENVMKLAYKSKELYGNKFSYILIDERDTLKFKNTALLIVGIGLIAVSTYLFNIKNK